MGDEGLNRVVTRLHRAIEFASAVGRMTLDKAARALWQQVYQRLSEGRAGLFGAITARAEAQVLRLAIIYSLLDLSDTVRVEHLRAALAMWDYCDRSARWIFHTVTGDRDADKILPALQKAGTKGMTATAIAVQIFSKHIRAERLREALSLLQRLGLAEPKTESTGGAPRTTWISSDLNTLNPRARARARESSEKQAEKQAEKEAS